MVVYVVQNTTISFDVILTVTLQGIIKVFAKAKPNKFSRYLHNFCVNFFQILFNAKFIRHALQRHHRRHG